MMNSIILDKDDSYKFRGQKLILECRNLKIELSKLPYRDRPKDPVFELCGSKVVLANVLDGEAAKFQARKDEDPWLEDYIPFTALPAEVLSKIASESEIA